MSWFGKVKAVFKREFRSYFDSPVAYVFLVAFLVLVGFLTFGVAMFYERRQADLAPFFFWHPWVYLLLVPAATMGVWADERRNGTAELLLTLPMTVWQVFIGKFLAAWSFIGIALTLTFPVAATAGYLGNPDWGVVFCGYLGSLLLAGAATAIGLFASSVSRSSVVGFVVSLVLLFALLIIGFDPVVGALASWGVSSAITDGIAACSLLTHFESVRRGVVDFADLGYYAGVIVIMLAAAKTVTDGRRGVARGLVGLSAVVVIAVAADVILAQLPLRCDMTADRLYTLSDGSKEILGKLDSDVTVKFYVSSSEEGMPMALKPYVTRVTNLLDEYERAAGGRIVVETYDPKPDTDAEDDVRRYRIEPQQDNRNLQPFYFGLVAVCGDREETLGVLSPRTEATLEYDITRLVTRVVWPERPVVGVMSSLKGVLGGKPNPMMMQMGQRPNPGWVMFSELAKDYDVREVAPDAKEIDPAVKALVVVHAKDLSDATLYAIDQFVLRGGKLIACVDPFSIQDLQSSRQNQSPMMQQMGGGDGPSTLGKLFEAWGVGFETERITCDGAAATSLNDGRGGVRAEPAFLSLGKANLDEGDILMQNLSQLLFPFAGALTFAKKDMDLAFSPVITTSKDNSYAVDKMTALYGGKTNGQPDGQSRVVAARLAGTFKTVFPKGPDGTNDVSKALSEGKGTVMLFADSDFLSDDCCVRMLRTPFGAYLQPVSDNLALFSNVMELFAGREELIGVRSRGPSDRPFEKVKELEAASRSERQKKIDALNAELEAAQRRFQELQAQKQGQNRMILSKEQQDEIERSRNAVVNAQKQLRTIEKEQRADVEALGFRLKCLNVALVPFLVIVFGLVRGFLRRKRR